MLSVAVVGRVPAFQPGGPGSIPGGVRNFNFCPGIGCVSFVFCPVLSLAEARHCADPTFREARPCVLVQRLFLPPYRHLTHGHLACKSLGV